MPIRSIKIWSDRVLSVRNRTNVTMCNGCLRITVGKSDENDALLEALKKVKI